MATSETDLLRCFIIDLACRSTEGVQSCPLYSSDEKCPHFSALRTPYCGSRACVAALAAHYDEEGRK